MRNDGDLKKQNNTYAINLMESGENIGKTIELIAGCYVADEDIDLGKYSIKVLSGIGNMVVEDSLGNIRVNECVGIQDGFINKYNNLRLKNDDVLKISGNVVLECTRIK